MNVALFLEIKNEYTDHLVDTLTPYIYEGLTSIYKEAVRLEEEINKKGKVLMIFQKLLQSIDNWSQQRIIEETQRIKQLSNTSDYLDDLIKAVIKSNIILLAYSNNVSNVIGQSFYNSLTTTTFIHRCYTECAKDSHNNPYLFFHDVAPMDYKRNQIIIQKNIQSGIIKSVRKILPISMILKEYLINSMNIIQEPTKIELIESKTFENVANPSNNMMGMNIQNTNNPNINVTASNISGQKNQGLNISGFNRSNPNLSDKNNLENKIDSKLEKEVMNIIKSESIKTDKQKIKAIMNLDKMLTSIESNKQIQINMNTSNKSTSSKKPSSKKNIIKSDILSQPNLINFDEKICEMENNLEHSDKKLMNIKFDDEPINSSKKSISVTTIPNRPMPNNNEIILNPETTEKIDPSKVNLIEDYGPQINNSRRNNKKYYY